MRQKSDTPNKNLIKPNIKSGIREINQLDNADDNNIISCSSNNNSQNLQQELSKKTELISQLQLQIKSLSSQLEEQTKKNNKYDGMDNFRSDSKTSITTGFVVPILFEELRQDIM